jgi:hypothetical protein
MALAFFGLAALTAMGQQTDRVNTSRSNVKNNLPQVVSGPFGKVWCATPPAGKPAACTPSQVAQLSTALAKNSDAKAENQRQERRAEGWLPDVHHQFRNGFLHLGSHRRFEPRGESGHDTGHIREVKLDWLALPLK